MKLINLDENCKIVFISKDLEPRTNSPVINEYSIAKHKGELYLIFKSSNFILRSLSSCNKIIKIESVLISEGENVSCIYEVINKCTLKGEYENKFKFSFPNIFITDVCELNDYDIESIKGVC